MGKVIVDKFCGEVFLRTEFEIWESSQSAGQIDIIKLVFLISNFFINKNSQGWKSVCEKSTYYVLLDNLALMIRVLHQGTFIK